MNKLINRSAVVLAVMPALIVAALLSGTYTDPTGGAYDDAVQAVSDFVTTTAAGPLFVLAGVVLAITVGLRWIKKARSAAT